MNLKIIKQRQASENTSFGNAVQLNRFMEVDDSLVASSNELIRKVTCLMQH
jgi:hypothetical protein